MDREEHFYKLIETLYQDKNMYNLYVASLLTEDIDISQQESSIKLEQIHMLENFLKEQSDIDGIKRLEKIKKIIQKQR